MSNKTTPTVSLMKELIGGCMCQVGAGPQASNDNSRSSQFVSIHGIEFIGLGAVIDELTAKERVYDTLEQLTTRTERLISIGYLSVEDASPTSKTAKIAVETVPLDVWEKTYPNDQSMAKHVKKKIANITSKKFDASITEFHNDLKSQRANPQRGTNGLVAGITAHNLAVLHVLAGNDQEIIPLFQEAIDRKRDAFGHDHPQVAISLDEIGIQYFAAERFPASLQAFQEARQIRAPTAHNNPSKMAMVLNNIACCHFQMGQHTQALTTLEEARNILKSSAANATDLDLLHVAITNCNYAYLLLQAKKYEEARVIFEEELLIQQSVLGDNHRAIRDTLSNIEFTNAFHS
ncbi:Kinesin light chain [Seminavis robusta]|uniref:Kinesin light chain n=1 Tax=Seminavis robusta TaxID=568900 RepID=A0A9N8DJK3_9STRA|nr:Kinesin light chain [Seminavis robusta]|eukprot:Sro163_g073250.1 Kinesin light chain (348) ;mRNA; r:56424-57699